LLELHHQLGSIQQLDKASRIYIDALLGHFAAESSDQERAELAKIYKPVMRMTMNPLVVERLANIKEGYQACLLKLAAVDPLNAYLLRGQQEILSSIDRVLETFQNPEAHGINFEAASPGQLMRLRPYFEEKLLPKATTILSSIIRELASTVGGATSQKLEQVLASRSKNEEELDKIMKELMEGLPAIIDGY
jgi:hypothetical protein